MPTTVKDTYLSPSQSRRSLPNQLLSSVPVCAQSCLEQYISKTFPCPEEDFSCLCSTYSSVGYTVGEFAYLCLSSYCALPSKNQSTTAYDICSTQTNAVQPTQSILTPPATISIVADPTATQSPAMNTSSVGSIPVTETPPTMPESSSQKSSQLTDAQAVGISVAAMGSLVLGVLVIYLVIRFRRRKGMKSKTNNLEKLDASNFLRPHPRDGPTHVPNHLNGSHPQASRSWFDDKIARRAPQQQSTHIVALCRPKVSLPSIRVRPRASSSCYSVSSAGVVSQLLPERPEYNPKYLAKPLPTASIRSPITLFEEDMPSRHSAALPKVLVRPPSSQPVSNPKPLPPTPVSKSGVEHPQPAPENSLRVVHDLGALRPVNSCWGCEPLSRAASSKTINSLIDFYHQIEGGSPEEFYTAPSRPTRQITLPPRASRPKKKSSLRSKNRHPSPGAASGTTIESADMNDITPPEELERSLSPVRESSAMSTISSVQYPKIPRGSNQAVPRSPRAERLLKQKNRIRTRYPVAASPSSSGSPNISLMSSRQQLPSYSINTPPQISTRSTTRVQSRAESQLSLRTSSSSDTRVGSPTPERDRDSKVFDID